MLMKKLIVFTLVLFCFYACDTNNDTKESGIVVEENTPENNNQHCFLNTFEGEPIKIDGKIVQQMRDSTILNFTIEGNTVKGIYNEIPAEKDARIGGFVGDLGKNNEITGVYTFTQEGDTYKHGIIIEMKENEAIVSLVEINITKTENATTNLIEEALSIKKVNCN